MQMDKIIFLDFDGVIRITGEGIKPLFSKRACSLIDRLCDITGAKIVVASDLRNYAPFDTIDRLVHLVPISWNNYHECWKTPNLSFKQRCWEIINYLGYDNIDNNYICIDDNQEIYIDQRVREHCVWTNYRQGFTEKEFELALEKLT